MSEAKGNDSAKPPVVAQADPVRSLEELLQAKAPDVIKGLPPEARKQLSSLSIEMISVRSGILPPPEELDAYNRIIPNGADRLLKMAEMQQAHRINIEGDTIRSQNHQGTRGQWFGFIIALICILVAGYSAISGFSIFASILGGSTLLGLVSIFCMTQHKQKQELAEKRAPLPTVVNPKRKKS